MIKINNLSITYFKGRDNEMRALKNVNLEIYPGEFVIFFGPSGCGKSTLLYAISGLETEIDGEIIIDGQDISNLKSRDLELFHQRKIGMIFQAYYLIGSLSVLKNVILPQVVNRHKSNKERKKRAMELLSEFGISQEYNRYPSELSGGQQQRVAISRALVNDPDVLLADEPVGNLDSKSSEDVMKLFSKLNEEQKKTVILVTHNPSHLDMAHRVFFIKDGNLVSIKKNRELGEKFISKHTESASSEHPLTQDLRLLKKIHPELSLDETKPLFKNYKAREVIFEVFTGMTSEELSSLEKYVDKLLVSGVNDREKMFHYLDENIKNGGLGLDKRTALNLTNKIKSIVNKINELGLEGKGADEISLDAMILKLRSYLETEFKIKFKKSEARQRFEDRIRDRLDGKINKEQFQMLINATFSKGGVGIHIRRAKKISDRLELLLLGRQHQHYKN
ncbi:ABC transporter ATP-binding protein [Patescibacteria group bacterium]|nr:ABC transporter ATP-binding protein [Patescibacteria group bacterium]